MTHNVNEWDRVTRLHSHLIILFICNQFQFVSMFTIGTGIFDIYCLAMAAPGSTHYGYFLISYEFVYVGNTHGKKRRGLVLRIIFNYLFFRTAPDSSECFDHVCAVLATVGRCNILHQHSVGGGLTQRVRRQNRAVALVVWRFYHNSTVGISVLCHCKRSDFCLQHFDAGDVDRFVASVCVQLAGDLFVVH